MTIDNNIVNSVINNIAEKLGIAVDYIIPALVKYNIAQCLIYTAYSIVLFLSCFIIFKLRIKINNEIKKSSNFSENEKGENTRLCDIISILLFLTALAFGIIFLFDGITIIKWIIAPEGSVINYILESIKTQY